jgi:hypothetical protein
LLWLGTDKLNSNNNYNEKYFVRKIIFIIFVKIIFMKKILVLVLLLISFNSFSQRKTEPSIVIDSISKIINKKVTFVSGSVENDTIKINQITIYDVHRKIYEHLYIEDIKKYYPKLLNLFTTKV